MDSQTKTSTIKMAALAAAIGPLLVGLAIVTKSLAIIAASPAFALIVASFAGIALQIKNTNDEIDRFTLKIKSFKEFLNFMKTIKGANFFSSPVTMATTAYRASKKLSESLWPNEPGLKSSHSIDGALAQSHSKADVTIRVQAEQGTNAQVEDVKKSSDFGLKILSDYMLGNQLGYGY